MLKRRPNNSRYSTRANKKENRQENIKIITTSFVSVTYSLGAAGFIGIALFQLLATMFAMFNADPSNCLSNALGASVCAIAGIHYRWMREKFNDISEMTATRYSDWYITTILMLIEFFNLAGTLVSRWGWLLGACLSCELMIISGHIATVNRMNKYRYYLIYVFGILCSFVLIICYLIGTVLDNSNDNTWMHIFASLWILYPFAFWTESYKNLTYNILDFYAKGIFGLVLGLLTFTAS